MWASDKDSDTACDKQDITNDVKVINVKNSFIQVSNVIKGEQEKELNVLKWTAMHYRVL